MAEPRRWTFFQAIVHASGKRGNEKEKRELGNYQLS